jgi:type II pantothenate kinase
MHFETKNMVTAIKYVSSTAPLVENIRTIGCTGGGAHKFAGHFEEELGITFDKFDELMCLVRGMHFALNHFEDECYTYRKSDEEDDANRREKKIPTKSNGLQPIKEVSVSDQRWRKDIKEHTRRVTLHFDTLSSFPYLVVNIGSGVSIVKVTGPGKAERVSGTSLGGGTYWGLSRLLTTCKSYEEVLNLAEQGDASVVDMLVRDIYGGDCKFMLHGCLVLGLMLC